MHDVKTHAEGAPTIHRVRRKAFVFDIDGTLADGTHRLHHLGWTFPSGGSPIAPPPEFKKDWPAYFAAAGGDTLILPVAEILRALYGASYADCLYCTSRDETAIPLTREWLAKHRLPDVDIYHRCAGDRRHDDIVKLELFKEIEAHGYDILAAFEDRRRVATALRAAGYVVAHVAEGDF